MEQVPEPRWHVVVPVKGGPAAKSRLRSTLDASGLDDGAIVAAVAHDTLAVTADVVGTGHVVVVTAEPGETAYAISQGFVVVSDPGTGLDDACSAGVREALGRGGTHVAVLLGDHPALTAGELEAVLRHGSAHPSFFVADAEGTGTALVGTTTGRGPALAFGPGSAARHLDLGHVPLDVEAPGLRHDVDDDVSLRWAVEHLRPGPRTLAALGR
ncbi:2-phospho-L-lactate guanylyltransferase [Knoellia flava TL1]|uniref:2-phospho-L-lactate guanylyltransferase n=2 Tax=Knoellia flava TaxID=913969 RepID=A0A8H9FW03_9MICO|nr:NTP transferase domain-containing protein [Knoellia flava]KGN28822.1 2-phospho-L-lactate guanylyltransferase [Knoellia flava TL1]GGB85827.1 2-phospho-L-lactate guanylyltransferase [Knoellia flava]